MAFSMQEYVLFLRFGAGAVAVTFSAQGFRGVLLSECVQSCAGKRGYRGFILCEDIFEWLCLSVYIYIYMHIHTYNLIFTIRDVLYS